MKTMLDGDHLNVASETSTRPVQLSAPCRPRTPLVKRVVKDDSPVSRGCFGIQSLHLIAFLLHLIAFPPRAAFAIP